MCFDKSIFLSENFWVGLLVFVEFLTFLTIVGFGIKFTKNIKDRLVKLAIAVLLSIVFILASFAIWVGIIFITEPLIGPIASNYAPLNAAIKNTCFLDPQMRNCPRSVDEIIAIQSEQFANYKKVSDLFYEYRPQQNSYTLIVLERLTNKGVIFDPRLDGYDFKDVTYKTCSGKVEINEKPPFDGLWDHLQTKLPDSKPL